jgi:nitrogen fixation/metabolism regulation signal transduction histidine kinase
VIETEHVENYSIATYHKVIRIELKTKDNTIQLSVSDTSTGLGAEDLSRVLEP